MWGGTHQLVFQPKAPARDLLHQPTRPPLSRTPHGGLLFTSTGEGRGGGELRQTYFQGFNPFCLKDFFFFFFGLGKTWSDQRRDAES